MGITFLTKNEVGKLMAVPNVECITGLRNRLVMGMMHEAGLRVSEVLGLHVEDVEVEEKRVDVLRGKGARPRVVYFHSEELVYLLERWLRERPEPDSSYLFINIKENRGERMSPDNVNKIVARYAEKAGIRKPVSPHVLRHTFATELLREGNHIRLVQVALGHRWLTSTMVYTHVENSEIKSALAGRTAGQ